MRSSPGVELGLDIIFEVGCGTFHAGQANMAVERISVLLVDGELQVVLVGQFTLGRWSDGVVGYVQESNGGKVEIGGLCSG